MKGSKSVDWCEICGIRHGAQTRCSGELQATGPERHGWRVNVETSRGIEAYGVLLAECGSKWRARILTFPHVLWTVPGGSVSMKFVARTSEAAEIAASRFIREHCHSRGLLMRDEVALSCPELEAPTRAASGKSRTMLHPRFLRSLPVRYGENRPTFVGVTRDLSETGLFVATETPAVEATLLGLLLQMEHLAAPLRGSVVWSRRYATPGRPPGMGIRLHEPSQGYVSYVRALA